MRLCSQFVAGVYQSRRYRMDDELVSIKTLSSILECSPKTVRDWMYKDRRAAAADPLPYYRLGGLVRFRRAEVSAWINRRRIRNSAVDVAIRRGRNP